MKICFMGTSEFAVPILEAIHHSDHFLAGVFTQPDRRRGRGLRKGFSPVKQFCLDCGLPLYQPEAVKDSSLLPLFKNLNPDVIIVVAFGQFLPSWLLRLPPLGCLNLHPSILPAYRGPAPIQRAVINGEKETGVTIMFLNEEMDAGDIILQEKTYIGVEMTYGELSDLLAERGSVLMMKTLEMMELSKVIGILQDHERATYAPAIRSNEARLDWTESAQRIYNKIRGMDPLPGAYTLFKGKILKIWRVEAIMDNSGNLQPGQVLDAEPKKGLIVQTGKGCLRIMNLQPEGRKSMTAAEFLRGHSLPRGTVLGE